MLCLLLCQQQCAKNTHNAEEYALMGEKEGSSKSIRDRISCFYMARFGVCSMSLFCSLQTFQHLTSNTGY
jgi:hypothetical protein